MLTQHVQNLILKQRKHVKKMGSTQLIYKKKQLTNLNTKEIQMKQKKSDARAPRDLDLRTPNACVSNNKNRNNKMQKDTTNMQKRSPDVSRRHRRRTSGTVVKHTFPVKVWLLLGRTTGCENTSSEAPKAQ